MDSSGYLRTGQGICNMPQYLLAGLDVWRGTRAAPRSCHDVTCPDINLDFPEALPEVGCETRLGNCNMEQDSSLTENWLVHRDSKSPTAGYYPALPCGWHRFTSDPDRDLFVNLSWQFSLPPALVAGKRACTVNPEASGQVGLKQNLGRNTSLKLSKVLKHCMVSKPPASCLKIMWVPCIVVNQSV
jgi:hypothetical protein